MHVRGSKLPRGNGWFTACRGGSEAHESCIPCVWKGRTACTREGSHRMCHMERWRPQGRRQGLRRSCCLCRSDCCQGWSAVLSAPDQTTARSVRHTTRNIYAHCRGTFKLDTVCSLPRYSCVEICTDRNSSMVNYSPPPELVYRETYKRRSD